MLKFGEIGASHSERLEYPDCGTLPWQKYQQAKNHANNDLANHIDQLSWTFLVRAASSNECKFMGVLAPPFWQPLPSVRNKDEKVTV